MPSRDEAPIPPFPWYENLPEDCLHKLHRLENIQQRVIARTVAQLLDSHHYWQLMSGYTNATEGKSRDQKEAALHALCARLFIAGTFHAYPLQEEVIG